MAGDVGAMLAGTRSPSGRGGFGRDRGSLVPVMWAASAGGKTPVRFCVSCGTDVTAEQWPTADFPSLEPDPGWPPTAAPWQGAPSPPGQPASVIRSSPRPSATAAHVSAVAFRTCPAVAVRPFGAMAVRRFGAMAVRRFGAMAVRRFGAMAVRRFGAMAVRRFGAVAVRVAAAGVRG